MRYFIFLIAIILTGCSLQLNNAEQIENKIVEKELGGIQKVELLDERTYSSKTYDTGQKTLDGAMIKESEFHTKWIHYMDENEEWEDIDCTFVDKGTHFEMNRAPFIVKAPKQSTDRAEFINNKRYDVGKKEIVREPSMTQGLRATGIATTTGVISTDDNFGNSAGCNHIVYENVYSNIDADVIYYIRYSNVPSLKKIVRINTNPNVKEDYKLDFELDYSEEASFEKNKPLSITSFWDKTGALIIEKGETVSYKRSATSSIGIAMRKAQIWDSGNPVKIEEIEMKYTRNGDGTYKLTKILPKKFLDNATYPVYTDTEFYPDDDPESSSMSAFVIANGSTSWDTEHDSTTADVIGASFEAGTRAIEVGIGCCNWTIAKAMLLFDTGSTINGDTVDSAIFSIYSTAKSILDNDGNDFVGLVQVQAITSNTAVTDTDLDEVGDTIDNPTEGAPRIDISADWATNAYNDFTLDATGRGWIANTSGGKNPSSAPAAGITQLGLREGHDIVDDEPGARNFVRIDGSGATGTSTDPVLKVTHSAALAVNIPARQNIIWFN